MADSHDAMVAGGVRQRSWHQNCIAHESVLEAMEAAITRPRVTYTVRSGGGGDLRPNRIVLTRSFIFMLT
eukprot:scaffold76165_cov38-Tisochrysis_lutea.AAC.1